MMIEKLGKDFKELGIDAALVAKWTAQEQIKASRDWEAGVTRSLQVYKTEATNAAKGAELVVTNAFKNMESAIVDFAMTGSFSFTNFANSVIRDMTRMMVQQSITGPLAASMSAYISSLFATAAVATVLVHGGGIIGSSGGPMRDVPAPYFAGAPRLHGGLLPGEYPAILKGGEGVFTPDQMRAMGSGEVSVNVNVINQSPRVRAEVREGDNGRGSRDITVIISEIAGAEARRIGSPLNQGIRSIGGRTPLIRR